MAAKPAPPTTEIERTILVLRGHKVMLDSDLAALYGTTTKRLNEQVRRNAERFPADFMFQLTNQELGVLRSQFATSNERPDRGGRRYLPFVFTEHGALMAANVVNTPRAIAASVFVVRAFVRLREVLATQTELARRLDQLEQQTAALVFKHDTLASNTRAQFKQVIDALRELMATPEPKRRPIGFVYPKEKRARKATLRVFLLWVSNPPMASVLCVIICL